MCVRERERETVAKGEVIGYFHTLAAFAEHEVVSLVSSSDLVNGKGLVITGDVHGHCRVTFPVTISAIPKER